MVTSTCSSRQSCAERKRGKSSAILRLTMLTDSQAKTLALLYALQPKTRIELTAIMFPAAGKTGDCAVHAADSRELLTTMRAVIDEPRGVSSRWKRKVMTPLLVANPQVVASLAPFNAMRQDPALASTKLSEKMRQLVSQRSLDFGRMLKQPRV
jgi:hypothetical protein